LLWEIRVPEIQVGAVVLCPVRDRNGVAGGVGSDAPDVLFEDAGDVGDGGKHAGVVAARSLALVF